MGVQNSDSLIVPKKRVTTVEGRGGRIDAAIGGNMADTQRSESVFTKLDRLSKVVEERRNEKLTSLAHLLTEDLLVASFSKLAGKSSPGVDGVTVDAYGRELAERINDLCYRLRQGRYRASPVRRVFIPKANGKKRPLGLPTVEDKVVQGAVAEILARIYEPEFLGFSYGFRPHRGAQQAQDDLDRTLQSGPVNWVLDVDIKSFFDNLSHQWLRNFLEHRISDKRLLSIIGKWLKAGVIEPDGRRSVPNSGTPQGGVISPLLANVYLHYVFDLWADRRMRKKLRGRMYPFRYADDIIVGFQHEEDARMFLKELQKRLADFDLELHPDKTQLTEFGRGAWNRWRKGQSPRPKGFTFLGLTFYCGTSRKGRYWVSRVTSAKSHGKFKASLSEVCRRYRHTFLLLHDKLCRMLNGHYAFFGVPGNMRKLQSVYYHARATWRKWLSRRGQNGYFSWGKFYKLLERYPLPVPKLIRSPLCQA
jgi:RNA-directed DNA polymerase